MFSMYLNCGYIFQTHISLSLEIRGIIQLYQKLIALFHSRYLVEKSTIWMVIAIFNPICCSFLVFILGDHYALWIGYLKKATHVSLIKCTVGMHFRQKGTVELNEKIQEELLQSVDYIIYYIYHTWTERILRSRFALISASARFLENLSVSAT